MAPFLEKFISSLDLTLHPDELITVKDIDFKYQYASPRMVIAHGFTKLSELRGKTISQTNSPLVKIAQELHAEDYHCVSNNRVTRNIFHSEYATDSGFFLMERYPIQCSNTQVIHGILIKINKIKSPWVPIKVFNCLIKYRREILAMPKTIGYELPIKLTKREQLVLFLCVLNYKLTDIAAIVSIVSNKEININLIRNTLNQQLYLKFSVSNIVDLIEKAISLNYNKVIPKELLEIFKSYSI